VSGVLVVDAGTSSVRAAVVRPDATVDAVHQRAVLPACPSPGFVEIDPPSLASAPLPSPGAALAAAGPVDAVGIASQRASTVVWDRASGRPVGPGIGWQDLRTVGLCLVLQDRGVRLAPNASATKLAVLLDIADPDRRRDLCFGTIDAWLAWSLSAGELHVTDASNAGVTGLVHPDASGWDPAVLAALRVPEAVLPTIVDSSGVLGPALALPGAPPIAGLAGDQQASLVGQGCTQPGSAKFTAGTGGLLDLSLGRRRPEFPGRGPQGCFPIVAWRRAGVVTWGLEAVMLSAGACLAWLRDGLGLLDDVADSDALAASAASSGEVWFVPALAGMGTPAWDFGARGLLLGLSGTTARADVVRAVLEGVAHRAADLVEAAEADAGMPIGSLRVDGGMSANTTFVQLLARATQRPVEVSPVVEATTLGAGFLAGMAVGLWAGEADVAATWSPRQVVEPGRPLDRARWLDVRNRAAGTVPELSALSF
jgi:glycerol kinase